MSISYINGGAAPGAVAQAGPREGNDEQMEQIRELLLGDLRGRIGRLESRMDAIEARLAALSGEIDSDRRATFDTLAKGVSELAEQVRHIAKR
jgi:hypothetical protein